MPRILALSGAKVVVALGARAQQALASIAGVPSSIGVHGPVLISGTRRLLLNPPHPNARKERRIDKVLTPPEFERVVAALR